MDDPWGVDEPAFVPYEQVPLPPRLARLAKVQATGVALTSEDPYVTDFPDVRELPEVQRLMDQGWCPLGDAPLYCLLPAAWPRRQRAWLPDRRPHVVIGASSEDYYAVVGPREHDDEDWLTVRAPEHALAVGLSPPPRGRIWLLRSPWPRIPVSVIVSIIWSVVEREPTPTSGQVQQMYWAAREILHADEAAALARCPTATRHLLGEWASAGRVGENAASVISHDLTPADLHRMTALTGLDEPKALRWLDVLQRGLDDEVIDFIAAWQSAGLPVDPPAGAERFFRRDLAEVRTWLDAGFDLYAAHQLELTGLTTAIRWRDAGFTTADTYELLRDDPALTPDEAHAFDAAGLAVKQHRRQWVYLGFSASEAAAWTAVGLSPGEARLWRACGSQPTDVEAGHKLPRSLESPQGSRPRYVSASQQATALHPEWDELADPPGTRGRRARRAARDVDPRIEAD